MVPEGKTKPYYQMSVGVTQNVESERPEEEHIVEGVTKGMTRRRELEFYSC